MYGSKRHSPYSREGMEAECEVAGYTVPAPMPYLSIHFKHFYLCVCVCMTTYSCVFEYSHRPGKGVRYSGTRANRWL